MNITRLIVIIIISIPIYCLIRILANRILTVAKIKKLETECGATVICTRSPFSSLFRPSKLPDIIVEIGKKVYLCRFINGRGKRICFHFASENYYVTFSKTRHVPGIGTPGLRLRSQGSSLGFVTTQNRRVGILPNLVIPDKYASVLENDPRKIVPVLIFTPSPEEVSYVTQEKNSIRIAFTGDDFYGAKIFTPKSFVIYADRKNREENISKTKNAV